MTSNGKRYTFMRGLINYEKFQRTRHYLKSAAECTSRAIVSLELSETAVKSVRQAEKLEGIGGETASRLKKYAEEKKFSNKKPLGGIFTSAAGALLVALLECEERQVSNGHSPERSVLVPEATLKRTARSLSEEEFLPEDSTGFCQAWWRVEVLIKRDYIKRRSHHKSPVYTLLPLGREAAHRLRGDDITSRTASSHVLCTDDNALPALARSSVRKTISQSDNCTEIADGDCIVSPDINLRGAVDALYTNDTGKDGIIMLVDCSEMGGDRVALGQLCDKLGNQHIIYQTKRLLSGDYRWIWRSGGREFELPFLVERKRADDLSRSLKEGRFWPQVQKMTLWKKTFTDKGIDAILYYLLEGHLEDYVVRCGDGCQGVGMCGYPNVTQIKRAILDLEGHNDLTVLKTNNLEDTVVMLASITAELQNRSRKGDFLELSANNPEQAAKDKVNNNPVIILDDSDSGDLDINNVIDYRNNNEPSVQYISTMDRNIPSSSKSSETLKIQSSYDSSLNDTLLLDSDDEYIPFPTSKKTHPKSISPGSLFREKTTDISPLEMKSGSSLRQSTNSSPSYSGSSLRLSATLSSPTSVMSTFGRNDRSYCNQGYRDRDFTSGSQVTDSNADDENSDPEEILPLVQHHCADLYKKKILHKKVYGELGTDLTYIPKINKEDIPRSVWNRNHPYKASSGNVYSRRKTKWQGPSTL